MPVLVLPVRLLPVLVLVHDGGSSLRVRSRAPGPTKAPRVHAFHEAGGQGHILSVVGDVRCGVWPVEARGRTYGA